MARKLAAIAELLGRRTEEELAGEEDAASVMSGFNRTAAEVSAALNMTSAGARVLVGHAEALAVRLPAVAAALAAGHVDWRATELICTRTELVRDDVIGAVDAALSPTDALSPTAAVSPTDAVSPNDAVSPDLVRSTGAAGGAGASDWSRRRPKIATRMITTRMTGTNGPGAHQLNAISHSRNAPPATISQNGTRRARSEVIQPSMAARSVPASGIAAQASR